MIISKSVMISMFVEFIDQLIDYPINCASLKILHGSLRVKNFFWLSQSSIRIHVIIKLYNQNI